MRSFHSQVALFVAASALASIVQAGETGYAPSWSDYRSTVNNSVKVDDSYNTEVTKTTTNTDNSKKTAIDGSFNRSTDVKTSIDGSFNRSTDIKTQDDHSTDSSYNTDIKKVDDHSIRDSYNRLTIDTQTVSPNVQTSKYVSTLDTQTANNSGSIEGPKLSASQGGFSLGSVGEESSGPVYYGYGAKVSTEDNRALSQSNSAVIEGHNFGAVSNMNMANQGRDMVLGPNRSIVGSDLGNKQIMSTGDQTQLQSNTQDKKSATTSTAYDQVQTSASK